MRGVNGIVDVVMNARSTIDRMLSFYKDFRNKWE